MADLKGYALKASPVLVLILGYFGYVSWAFVDTDDARVTAEVIPITARVSGVIDKVSVVELQEVKKGDTIAQFDERSYKKAVGLAESGISSAQAKLHEAEGNQAKASILLKNKALTQEKFAETRTLFNKATSFLKSAREKLEQAKLNLENTRVTAPQDGNIFKKYVSDGAFVSEGQNLFGFVTSSTRWVTGNFSELQIKNIKLGTIAKVKVGGIGGKSYDGTVESIVKRNTPGFAQHPPEAGGPNLSKNSSRTIVKIGLINLSNEDKITLQDGLPATISIPVR